MKKEKEPIADCKNCCGKSNWGYGISTYVFVTLLHLGDTVSNHQDIDSCMASAGNAQIDYREQNTLIDPELCEHCVSCY
jgi:hypothetical protein